MIIMEDDKKIHWLIFMIMIMIMIIYLFIYLFTDAGESALIKKLPPGSTYAHFRKKSADTSNVIGKNKILF